MRASLAIEGDQNRTTDAWILCGLGAYTGSRCSKEGTVHQPPVGLTVFFTHLLLERQLPILDDVKPKGRTSTTTCCMCTHVQYRSADSRLLNLTAVPAARAYLQRKHDGTQVCGNVS